MQADPGTTRNGVLGDAGTAWAMSNGELAQAKTGGAEESGKVPMHALKGDKKSDILPLDDFQGATRIVGPIHQYGATDRICNFGCDLFLPRIHARSSDAASEVGLVAFQKLQERR